MEVGWGGLENGNFLLLYVLKMSLHRGMGGWKKAWIHLSKIKMVLNITTIISRNLSYDGCTSQKAGDRKRKSGRHFRLQGRTERQRSIFGPGPHIWCLQASNFQSTLDPWRTEKVFNKIQKIIILNPFVWGI